MTIKLDAAGVRDAWTRSVRSTQRERQQAVINRSFMRSKQWVIFNRSERRLEEVTRAPGRIRATMNRVGPDSRIIIAKLMRRPLQFEVPPQAPDDASMRASRIAESALRDVHRSQSWENVRSQHAWATWEAGVAGLCVEWDAYAGAKLGVADDKGRQLGVGESKVSSVSIHEMATLPGVRDIERAPWWIRGQALPPEVAQEEYGLPSEPAPDAYSIDGVWRMGQAEEDRGLTPLTMVLTVFHRPTKAVPEGSVVTIVGSSVVDEAPWPFPWDDRLNLTVARVVPLDGVWYGHTPVTDAIPIQAAYNATHSNIMEHMRQAGNARLWVPMGSVEDLEELTDTPGEAIEYVPINNLRPQYEAPPAMPDWWQRHPDLLRSELDDTLGVHEVSRGAAPAGVESGVALSILSENDDTPVGMFAKELAECWARAASLVLRLFEEKVTEPRTATIRGEQNVPENAQWTGSELAGHVNAEVPLDSVMPRSRAAQAAYALQLYDRQIITSPHQLAKVADLPDQDDLLAGLDPDTAKAQRENLHLAVGRPRLVDMIDDHANHIAVHRDFMRSARFEGLPEELQALCVDHITAHEQYAGEQAAMQTMMAQVSPMAAAIPTAATKPVSPESIAAGQAIAMGSMPVMPGGPVGAPMPGPPMPDEGAMPPEMMNPEEPVESTPEETP